MTHHNLKVCAKALAFIGVADGWLPQWGKRHAVVDELRRASESVLLNLAEGSRLRLRARKAQALDDALGSTLECAACLDIACIKKLGESSAIQEQKSCLWEITLMLVALRKAWLSETLKKDPVDYQRSESDRPFHHERLDVYQAGLAFMRWFSALPGGRKLADPFSRRIDQVATAILLNIAEGNGRYSQLDQTRFLDLAASATVKGATYLDLWEHRAASPMLPVQTHPGHQLLRRILAMRDQMME